MSPGDAACDDVLTILQSLVDAMPKCCYFVSPERPQCGKLAEIQTQDCDDMVTYCEEHNPFGEKSEWADALKAAVERLGDS